MPGDDLKHVASGDPVDISHSTWNILMDAGRTHLANKGRKQSPDLLLPPVNNKEFHVVMIRNATGVDLKNRGVFGYEEPIFTPTENLNNFKTIPQFKAIPPAAGHAVAFGITLEPIADGKIGKAVVSGVVQCKINIVHVAHTCAGTIAGNVANLTTGVDGSAKIIWHEGMTGIRWAIVSLKSSLGYCRVRGLAVGSVQGDAKFDIDGVLPMRGESPLADPGSTAEQLEVDNVDFSHDCDDNGSVYAEYDRDALVWRVYQTECPA